MYMYMCVCVCVSVCVCMYVCVCVSKASGCRGRSVERTVGITTAISYPIIT